MKKSLFIILAVVIALSAATFAQAKVVKKVDGFDVLVDLSGSMDQVQAEKDFLQKMNQMVPELGYQGAMRFFGFTSLITGPDSYSKLEYGVKEYNTEDFGKAIDKVSRFYGITPLGHAMTASGAEFEQMGERKALLIVSDFERSVDFGQPVIEAKKLAEKFGPKFCVYPVFFGQSEEAAATAMAVAKAAGCGVVFNGRECLENDAAMEELVTTVFAANIVVKITLNIEFDTNKDTIRPVYHDKIAKVAEVLQKAPGMHAVLEGHTDSTGSEQYNQKLSQRRAESVRQYLIEKFNIDGSRIKAVGYGESRPVADNKTEEGKQANRRVEAIFSNM